MTCDGFGGDQSSAPFHILAYNLTRVMNIMGIQPLMAAMRAQPNHKKAPSAPCGQDGYASTLPLKRFYTTKTQSDTCRNRSHSACRSGQPPLRSALIPDLRLVVQNDIQ